MPTAPLFSQGPRLLRELFYISLSMLYNRSVCLLTAFVVKNSFRQYSCAELSVTQFPADLFPWTSNSNLLISIFQNYGGDNLPKFAVH